MTELQNQIEVCCYITYRLWRTDGLVVYQALNIQNKELLVEVNTLEQVCHCNYISLDPLCYIVLSEAIGTNLVVGLTIRIYRLSRSGPSEF